MSPNGLNTSSGHGKFARAGESLCELHEEPLPEWDGLDLRDFMEEFLSFVGSKSLGGCGTS